MSTDYSGSLSTIFDEVAATITPRADFAGVQAAAGGTYAPLTIAETGGKPPFRRNLLAAAAALLLVAGAAFALRSGGEPDTVSTAPELTEPDREATASVAPSAAAPAASDAARPAPETADELSPNSEGQVEIAGDRSAEVIAVRIDRDPVVIILGGTAPSGESIVVASLAGTVETRSVNGYWKVELPLTGLGDSTDTLALTISFGGSDEVVTLTVEQPMLPADERKDGTADEAPPKDEVAEPSGGQPGEKPVAVAFTASLSATKMERTPPKVLLTGTAQPGATVTATSEYGGGHVTAGDKGGWEMWLVLPEMPGGATAHIRVTNSATDGVYEFDVTKPSAPPTVEFTAAYAEGVVEGNPIWQRYNGTAQPGSVVTATSPYGTNTTTVGENGNWTLRIDMHDVPAGTTFQIKLTNTASDAIKKFTVETPTAPTTVEFTANAALTTSSSTPPFNEYWGTAQPGTVIVISSPYGGAERVAGEAGGWDARIEFPGAPIGETFVVKVKSVATGQVKEFSFTAVAPA
jgi:hypothetical protein